MDKDREFIVEGETVRIHDRQEQYGTVLILRMEDELGGLFCLELAERREGWYGGWPPAGLVFPGFL